MNIVCTGCKIEKCEEEFNKNNKNKKTGKQHICKKCRKSRTEGKHKLGICPNHINNKVVPGTHSCLECIAKNVLYNSKRNSIKGHYKPADITFEKVLTMLVQTRQCAIPKCNSTNLCLDHCHETGKVRGWLCMDHNKALGGAHDSPEELIALAEYLKSNL